jgi:hypothetical protein
MDIAVSIKRLLDEGMDKIAIRTLYARPKTTKEKGTPQPASNAWINIVHSFLDFPTHIQEAIHNGTLGYDAAYKLSTMPEDKWSVILEKAQADLTAMTIREEKDEEKFIAATKKEEALAAEAKAEEEKLAKVQATVDEAKAAHDEAVRLATEAQAKVAAAKSAKERKELVTVATPILKATGGTLLKLEACTKDLTKLQEAHNKREAARIDREAKAAQAQEARNKKGKATISRAHVEKAAVATGAVDKSAALTLAQVRTLFADLALAGSPEKVRAIANAVTETIMGRMTEKKLFVVLKTATGSK